MQIPLEITFHDLDRSDWSERFIRRQVKRLERYADHIVGCRVTVGQPHRHHRRGRPYSVRVEVSLPPRHVLDAVAEPVGEQNDADLRTVIRDAFRAMEKQLLKLKNMQRGNIKRHMEPTALVSQIFPAEGYGFLTTLEGEEIYFHRHSVVRNRFEKLTVGAEVRFDVEEGELGPQASTVLPIRELHTRLQKQPRRDIALEW
jgi:cold shock CspA family protein